MAGRNSIFPHPRCVGGFAALVIAASASSARAGMPAPLPSDFETVSRLTDSGHARVEAISFFVAGVLVSAVLVQLLWNGVRRDFPRLPRLRFPAALAAVVLWGLTFVVVLTMIAGARELMTPGAWEKKGMTYRLAGSEPNSDSAAERVDPRTRRLELVRTVLLWYAATNGGRFPESLDDGVPEPLRDVPGLPGLRYLYVPGLAADGPSRVLVYEPEVEHARRLALTTDGELRELTSDELATALGEATP